VRCSTGRGQLSSPGTILITGGAGFIGSNFVRHVLAHSGHRVVIVDKLTYAGSLLNLRGVLDDPRVTFVKDDIADRAAMVAVFAAHQPTAVVNFAAETHVDRSIDGPAAFVTTNIVGTFVLLDVALAMCRAWDVAAREAFRFLHVSTDEVYGSLGPDGLFREDTRTPRTRRTRRARLRPIIWCVPGSTPTDCRPSSRTVRTTTGRTSSPRSWSRSWC